MFTLRRPRILTLVWLALFSGLGLLVLHVLDVLPTAHGLFDEWLYNGLLIAAAALCLLRGAVLRAERAPWLLIGSGLAAWAAADLYWALALADLEEPPFPSLADAGWLVFYPALYAGAVLLLRRRKVAVDRRLWLDGVVAACSPRACELTGPESDPAEALRVADRAMYAQKDSTWASAGGQSMEVLVRVLAERNGELAEHLDDVASLCERTADRLGLCEAERTTIARAAVLHDVGKAAIPDAILSKPGPLSEDEWAFMRRHTVIGERILMGAPALAEVAALVRSSHERWDGTGYPDGLAETDIPLGARVIAVCDAYDAMVTDRPYRAAMSSEAAVAELRRCAGTQFDRDVVKAFAALLPAQTGALAHA